jgi:hypothetical protein
MWELICHHQYCWGTIAADRSPWHSDGRSSGVVPLPGETGLRFPTQQSRIVIPRRDVDAWGVMRAVRVEIVASRPQGAGAGALGGGGTLIDADQCFRIRFDGLHEIIIEILGQTLSFRFDELPAGNWVAIYFSHDGVNQLEYRWSYSLASGLGSAAGTGSPFLVPGQVPAVGPQGVWIGNRIGHPAGYLNGNIQSVKIWRLDPQTMKKNFVARPFPPALVDCWANFMRKLREAAAQDPECAGWLKAAIENLHSDVFQRLSQKSPETVADFWKMLNTYQRLWAAGKVGSPEMQDLVVRLRDWLKSEGVFSSDDPDLRPMLENPCVRKFGGLIGGLECDADAQTLLKAILGLGSEQRAHG